jgi:hypothetical protein
MLTIGLTGGIASGKSTVQAMFEALGAPVLDADLVARQVVEPGAEALAQIAAAFGAQMLLADGSLDRRRMREHVFGRPEELRRLEAITHPQIRRRMLDWKAAQTAPYCMLSVAILIEARATASTRPWSNACSRHSCRVNGAWRRRTMCWKTLAIWPESVLRSRSCTISIARSQPTAGRVPLACVCPTL